MDLIRLDTPELVALLVTAEDNVAEALSCDRDAWIQWLVENAAQPGLWVLAAVDEARQVRGYIVALDNVHPPLGDAVQVLYACSAGDMATNRAALEMLTAWARECGAKRVRFVTKDPAVHQVYGFRETGHVVMEMQI